MSAYPDVQPWQVRKACISPTFDSDDLREPCSKASLEDMYYIYLSCLLSPSDGLEAARQDGDLVKEYCELSIGASRRNKNPKYMKNFLNIVACSNPHHSKYRRDLMMLLDLSMSIDNEDLTLDVGKFLIFLTI